MTAPHHDEPRSYTSEFLETIGEVPAGISEILESYSGVAKDAQIQHIVDARNAAYEKCPYPCIGSFRFLNLDLAQHPLYRDHVVNVLKEPEQEGKVTPLFLDLGTCFGQDVRKLAFDGAPVQRLWASDVEEPLIDLGFKLFNDGNRLPRDHFLCPGDLLSKMPMDELEVLDNQVTILHLTAVFHLFTYEDQKIVADRCLRLLRKDTGGRVLILGLQVGSVVAGPFERENADPGFSHRYRHNEESWQRLWKEVSEGNGWRDRIKSINVKSSLVERFSGVLVSRGPSNEGDRQIRRHIFEIWVEFQ